MLEKYINNWYWLSASEALIWTPELIEKFQNKWDWYELSFNASLAWNTDLLDRFKHRWDMASLKDLSRKNMVIKTWLNQA